MRTRISLERLLSEGFGLSDIKLEEPRSEEFGDYTTNIAFRLARARGQSPESAAEEVARLLEDHPDVRRCEVARGFVNIWLTEEALRRSVAEIIRDPSSYASSDLGKGRRVLYEFVSANPTGPLNMVSARAAAFGDCLVRLARRCGFRPEAEFYSNDAGGQIEALGQSIAFRLGERDALPRDGYAGDYIIPVAERLRAEGVSPHEYGARAAEIFLKEQIETLSRFGVRFDRVVRESEIRAGRYRDEVLARLSGKTEMKEGALFLTAEAIRDQKDRVLIRSTGEPTYLFWDIAYHLHKAERGYDEMVNLLGPDHHTHGRVLTEAMKLMGIRNLRIKIIQQVHILRGGWIAPMSKRKGEFYTMEELMEEVGVDAARFFLLMRGSSQPLEFDIELAKTLASDNPVYYVQYLHARCSSLEGFAKEHGVSPKTENLSLLTDPSERSIMRKLLYLPDTIESACEAEEPHLIPHYLLSLAGLFHGYYQRQRIITDDRELSSGRLALSLAVRAAIREGLSVMGVSAPDKM